MRSAYYILRTTNSQMSGDEEGGQLAVRPNACLLAGRRIPVRGFDQVNTCLAVTLIVVALTGIGDFPVVGRIQRPAPKTCGVSIYLELHCCSASDTSNRRTPTSTRICRGA